MIGELRKYKTFFLLSTLVLFLSFSIDLFGAVKTDPFIHNFKDSEALVVNQAVCGGKYYGDQMLVPRHNDLTAHLETCQPQKVEAYSSQYGLQGKLNTLGYKLLHLFGVGINPYVALAQFGTALMTAIVFSLFALWIRARFGRNVALVVILLTAISPPLVGLARNLYWVVGLMPLPFIFALYQYPTVKNLKPKIIFWAILGFLFYIRFLCGYEYLTSITISAFAAISYHLFINKAKRNDYIKQGLITLAVAVGGFALALGTHIYTLQQYTGSTGKAIAIVKARALDRTTETGNYLQLPFYWLSFNENDLYNVADSYVNLGAHSSGHSEAWASGVSFIDYAFLPVINLPISLNQPFAIYAQSLTAFILVLILIYKFINRRSYKKALLQQFNGLYVMAIVGFIGYLSWLVLARAHGLAHPHVNGILMFLPFALAGYAIVGVAAENLVVNFWQRYKK